MSGNSTERKGIFVKKKKEEKILIRSNVLIIVCALFFIQINVNVYVCYSLLSTINTLCLA